MPNKKLQSDTGSAGLLSKFMASSIDSESLDVVASTRSTSEFEVMLRIMKRYFSRLLYQAETLQTSL